MASQSLQQTREAMTAPGKGLLAADESTPTITKRFKAIGLESTPELNAAYREMMFTTEGFSQWIGGVILFDETARQKMSDGTLFVQYLRDQGVVPGIKPDKGAKPLPGFDGQTFTQGLDGLRERLAEYAEMGLGFAKWRHAFHVNEDALKSFVLNSNAHTLATYGLLCQEAGIVPILEPEVLIDGDHSIAQAEKTEHAVLKRLFEVAEEAGLDMSGAVLKPSMVVAGKENGHPMDPEEIAEATIRVIEDTVPQGIPIVYLSGGQTPQEATKNLNAINAKKPARRHTFSYGRALQEEALTAWAGKEENVPAAQKVFAKRCKLTSLASQGTYSLEMEG